jgi:hypothetical protein
MGYSATPQIVTREGYTGHRGKKYGTEEMPVRRTLVINVVWSDGTAYVPLRDAATLLGVKRPFTFAAEIKKLGHSPDDLKKGCELKPCSRKGEERTLFISADFLRRCLEVPSISKKCFFCVQELKEALVFYST